MSFLLKRVPDAEKRLVAIPSSCYSSINLGFVVCSKILNVLWPLFYSVGQIFIVVNGQILKKQSNHLVTLIDSTVTVVKCMSLNILF